MGNVPPPKELTAFPDAQIARPKTSLQGGGSLRKRWKLTDSTILEWDRQHGAVEQYDLRGRHLGEFDPETGEQTKPRVRWYVSVYAKDGDFPVGEYPLADVNTAALQDLFGQGPDNPMYDVYPVGEAQAESLQAYAGHALDLEQYDYFVECVAE